MIVTFQTGSGQTGSSQTMCSECRRKGNKFVQNMCNRNVQKMCSECRRKGCRGRHKFGPRSPLVSFRGKCEQHIYIYIYIYIYVYVYTIRYVYIYIYIYIYIHQNVTHNVAIVARCNKHIAKCREMWPICENPVCPDPVWKPMVILYYDII